MPAKSTVDDSHIVLDEMNAQDTPGGASGGGTTRIVPFTATVRVGDLSRDQVAGLFTPQSDPTPGFPFANGGMIAHQFFRPYALTLDFVAMAKGMGVPGRAVATSDDFVKALVEAIAEPGPRLIEVQM